MDQSTVYAENLIQIFLVLPKASIEKKVFGATSSLFLLVLDQPLVFSQVVGVSEDQVKFVQIKRFVQVICDSEPNRFHRRTDSSVSGHEDGQGVFGNE